MDGAGPRILKKGSAETAAVARGDELIAAAERRAAEVLADAQADAERMRAASAADAEAARSAAERAGRADGLAAAAATLALAAAAREARLTELEGAVVDVALAVARQVVRRELASSPADVLELARRALRAAGGPGEIVLRVSSADLAAIRGSEEGLAAWALPGALSVVEDSALGRGEVVVEASSGRVDGRIEAQLEAFRGALRAEGR